MARTSLPPGFRFHPTDIELIMYYLKRKVMGKKLHFEAVAEVNIYKFGPWDLPDKSLLRSKDLEWYFFCPREKKHSCGARTKRSTEYGFWKMTGKDRSVIYEERTVGMIKTLIFYKGHAPKGERTNWVIHEYRIMDQNLVDEGITQDTYTLCKVFQKSGVGPKNGAQYGAPFNEEEWSDVEETCADPLPVDGRVLSVQLCPSNMNNSAAVGSTVPGSSCDWPISEPDPSTAGPSAINAPSGMPDFPEEDIDALLSMFIEDCDMLPLESNMVEMPETVRNGNNIQALPFMNGNDIHNGLEDPNWAGPVEAGFNFSTTMNPMPTTFMELKDLNTGYNMSPMPATVLDYGQERPLNLAYTMNSLPPTFMELKDLDTPLISPGLAYAAEVSESDRMRSGSSTYAPEAFCGNLDGSYYGYQGNFQSAVQNVSGLNQHSVMLEGSNWLGENLEGLRKENGTGNFEEHGFNAIVQENGTGNFEEHGFNAFPISCVPPEGSIIADQIQRQESDKVALKLLFMVGGGRRREVE